MSLNSIRLVGQHVSLIALNPGEHAQPLHVASHGEQREEPWQHLRDGPFADADSHRAHLEHLCASGQFTGFAIVNSTSCALLGQAALMKFSAEHRSAEIGYLLFLPLLQRTRGGTEVLYLLLQYGFENLGLRRFEWRCDSDNNKSERAALRLGFQREGLLRQHMLVKGRSRDTMIFSLLDREWAACRTALLTWLDDSNFDHQGIARSSLENITLFGVPDKSTGHRGHSRKNPRAADEAMLRRAANVGSWRAKALLKSARPLLNLPRAIEHPSCLGFFIGILANYFVSSGQNLARAPNCVECDYC